MSAPGRTESVYLVFVCSGNICRSPMAEIIVREAVEDADLAGDVLLASCGIGAWHVGQPADSRARDELVDHGYDAKHVAAQLGADHVDATMYIAMDNGHVSQLIARGIPAEKIRLMRSYDPESPDGAEVADPYDGDVSGFARTRRDIEAATPGLIRSVREALADMSTR